MVTHGVQTTDRGALASVRAPLEVDIDGGLVRLRAPYDPALVEQIRTLPGCRYDRERSEWVLPARRAALAELAGLLERLGEHAQPSARARRCLLRDGPGRIELGDGGALELSFAPTKQRLEAVRALPERRYLAELRRWRVAPTRAGALALLELVAAGEFVAGERVRARLERLASARAVEVDERTGESEGDMRASPTPHWRHVARGPIFEANPQRQQWVPAVGWCVRVRVDPRR